MQVVSIDIETVLDKEAAARCGYTPTDEFAPFPLHEIVCASVFSTTRSAHGETLYAVESFSRRTMSERGIVATIEEAVTHANVVLTYNGGRFDLPALVTRAMLYEVYVPRLVDLQNRSRVGRHCDLFEQIKREAGPVSLAQLCAPFSIPVKQWPAARVAQLVARQDWAALETYCETDAIACWLATQFWTKVLEPGFARESWRGLASWIRKEPERPSLTPFATVPHPPRLPFDPSEWDALNL